MSQRVECKLSVLHELLSRRSLQSRGDAEQYCYYTLFKLARDCTVCIPMFGALLARWCHFSERLSGNPHTTTTSANIIAS
eukprot:2538152-Pleurochrysis_carterae.AAC.4